MKPKKIIVFDTETTGIDEEDQVIQIGSIMHSNGRKYTDESFVKHTKEISIGSMTAHNIRKIPMLAQKLKNTKTIKRINKLEECDVIIGHNIDFDLRMTRDVLKGVKCMIVDTWILAEYLQRIGDIPEDAKLNLQYLRFMWLDEKDEKRLIKKYKPEGGAHTALFDVLITALIAEKMINEIANYLLDDPDTVWEFASNLYKNRFSPKWVKFTFGKYKGQTVQEVYEGGDTSYLEWFYENVDGREQEKQAIDNMVLKHNNQGK